MALNMKVTGKTTSNMVLERKRRKMAQSMKEDSLMAKRRELVFLNGQMAQPMRENSKTMSSKAKAITSGPTAGNMKALGKII